MFFGGIVPLTEKKGKKMDKKETTPVQFQINWEKLIPKHNCKLNSIILMEVHDVNLPCRQAGSFQNIVTYRRTQCKICNKVFEVSDPEGIK